MVRDLAAGECLAPLPVSADSAGNATGEGGDWAEIEALAFGVLETEGLEAAFAWLGALPDVRSHRHRFLQRLVMARVAERAGRSDTSIALLAELNTSTRAIPLADGEPALAFDIKQHLARALKASISRKDVDKGALTRRVAELHAEMTVLDPVRALTPQKNSI